MVRASRKSYLWFPALLAAVPIAISVDGLTTRISQWLLALTIWLAFGFLLCRAGRRDRRLLCTMAALSVLFEAVLALILHWYTYRMHNLPGWVPAGHGIVFFTALRWSRTPFAQAHERAVKLAASVGAVTYAGIGLGHQDDLVGAATTALLLALVWTVKDRGNFYAMLWLVVCWLEFWGVHLSAWHWSASMPAARLHEGGPPTGIAGVYGLVDLLVYAIVDRTMPLRGRGNRPRRRSLRSRQRPRVSNMS